MKGRAPSAARRLRRIHDKLVQAYGPQLWWPAPTAFEVILGAYLTQNTSWKAVERSLANLRAAGALTLEGFRALPLDDLRRLIQPSGFFTRKAPALKAFVAMVDEEFVDSLSDGGRANRCPAQAAAGVAGSGAGDCRRDSAVCAWPRRSGSRRISAPHCGAAWADCDCGEETAPARGKAARQGSIGYEALAELTRQAFAAEPVTDRARLFNEFHALTVAVGKAHCGRTARCEGCPLESDLPVQARLTGSAGHAPRSVIWTHHESKPRNPQMNLAQTPDYRETYANSVQVRVSVWDFQLVFGLATSESPDQVTIRNHQAIFLSPQQAKALWNVLGQNLAQYEQAFGNSTWSRRTRPFHRGR